MGLKGLFPWSSVNMAGERELKGALGGCGEDGAFIFVMDLTDSRLKSGGRLGALERLHDSEAVAWIASLRVPGARLFQIGGRLFCLMVPGCSPASAESLASLITARFKYPIRLRRPAAPLEVTCALRLSVIHSSALMMTLPVVGQLRANVRQGAGARDSSRRNTGSLPSGGPG